MSTQQLHPILSSSSSDNTSTSRTPTPVANNNHTNMMVDNSNNTNTNTSHTRHVSLLHFQQQQQTPFPSSSTSQQLPLKKNRMSMDSDPGLKTPVSSSVSGSSIERAGSHLRSLSIASTASTGSTTTSHGGGKKMGINLGLSFTGSLPPTGGSAGSTITSNNNNYVFMTPRLRSSSVKSPTFSISEAIQNSNNRFDEDQEIEYDSQSPEPLTPIRQNSSSTLLKTHNHNLANLDTRLAQTVSLNTDIPPPPQSAKSIKVDQSSNLLSDQLRLLASKEMEILDIKHQINTLVDRKRNLEFELQDLKVKVEKQLVLQITKQNNLDSDTITNKNVSPFDKHIPKSPLPIKKNSVHHYDSVGDPLLDDGFSSSSNDPGDEIDRVNQPGTSSAAMNTRVDSSGGSWFSKPLTFFQQFDNMIYQEFEKLQLPGLAEEQREEYEKEFRNKKQQQQQHNQDQNHNQNQKDDSSYVHVDKKEINEPIKALASLSSGQNGGNDVMQSVSNQLWSFVNEVKTNLINDDFAEKVPESKTPPTSRRFRTPSLSKRQSYGQYANKTHKRKTSSISKPQPLHQHAQSESYTKVSLKKDSGGVNQNQNHNHHELQQKEASLVLSSVDDSGNSVQDEESTSSGEHKKSVELKTFEKVDESDLWDNDVFDDL